VVGVHLPDGKQEHVARFRLLQERVRGRGRKRERVKQRESQIGILLQSKQRQHRTCPTQLCYLMYPASAALTSRFRIDSISTSYDSYE